MRQNEIEGVVRDEEFWADDVHVVLVAQGTAFRVRKETLSSVSPVFADIFENAQPAGEETWDGCPMVRVSDSAVDFRRFLRVVVQVGIDVKSWPSILKVCSVLISVIRVAHKYQADRVVDAAAIYVEEEFTYSSLACRRFDWWERNFQGTWEVFPSHPQCFSSSPDSITGRNIRLRLQDAFEVVTVAHTTDRPKMLPLALYVCCMGTPAQPRDGEVERLSEDDFARCRSLRSCAARRGYAFYFRDCGREDGRCEGLVGDSLAALYKGMRTNVVPELCHECNGWLMEHDYQMRWEAIQNSLPGCFDLDGSGKPLEPSRVGLTSSRGRLI
ncbi:hypothetical protein C8T65DRAFT_746473 [Cerioporus squamosus]|nr:hypothetical protein C8T65DRAFT_746473 [Cerioporus squamosus]